MTESKVVYAVGVTVPPLQFNNVHILIYAFNMSYKSKSTKICCFVDRTDVHEANSSNFEEK